MEEYDNDVELDGDEETENTEEFDDGFEDDYDDTDDAVDSDSEADDDIPEEWAWTKELDGRKVQKTWNQYTKSREEIKAEREAIEAMRQEIEPFKKLKDEILSDPGLVAAIEDYMQNAKPVDREVASVKNELNAMKAKMMTENELISVEKWVVENKYPQVDREDLLEYAVKNHIPNLQVAYKDMMFDELSNAKVKKVTDGIKRSKGAASIRTKKPSGGGKQGFGTKELSKMSDEDFIKNYEDILESYAH